MHAAVHKVVQREGGYPEWGWGACRVGECPISKSWLEVREACRGRSFACALSPSLGVLCLLAMSQPCNTGKPSQDALVPLLPELVQSHPDITTYLGREKCVHIVMCGFTM